MKSQDIEKLFTDNPDHDEFEFDGTCHDCHEPVRVLIGLSGDGFTITGGALYNPDEYYVKCDACYKKDGVLRNFKETEVFSRIVGYLRPVKQWNPGKVSEWKERETFNLQ